MIKFPKILDRYMMAELSLAIMFGVILFTIIWLAPERLFKLSLAMFDGKINASDLAQFLLLHIPETLHQSIPMAVLFGSIFVFRRLSLNFELLAVLGQGVSPTRLLVPVALVGTLFGISHFVVQEFLTPQANPNLEQLYKQKQLAEETDTNFTFVEKNRQGQLDKFLLIGRVGRPKKSDQDTEKIERKLSNFIILYYASTLDGGVQIERILRAPTGHWYPEEKAWQLVNGIEYELNREGIYKDLHKFEEQWVHTSQYPFDLLNFSLDDPADMSMGTLNEYINLLKASRQDQEVSFLKVRLNQKLIFPFTSIFFAIFGTLLGIERVRSKHQYSLMFGAVVLFVYSILVPFSTNLGGLGLLPPLVIAWLPILGALVTTVGLMRLRNILE